MDAGLITVFLIDVTGHGLTDPVFRRSVELAVFRILTYYKHHGMHKRWGFKFFNSEGDLKDGLSDKQHTYDMNTTAAETVRQELETVAQLLAAQKAKLVGGQIAAVSSDLRCKNISTALHSVIGDGQRNGSFHDSSARKEAVGSVTSIARTHHAIYLLSPSTGQEPCAGELHGADELCQVGATCDVLANAKRLNEAFIKYRIILQWIDTKSALASILGDSTAEKGTLRQSDSAVRRESHETLISFVLECMRDCKGSRIDLEALLQPSKALPFPFALELCLDSGLTSTASPSRPRGGDLLQHSRRGGRAGMASPSWQDDLAGSISASLDLNFSDRAADAREVERISLFLKAANAQGLDALRSLCAEQACGQSGIDEGPAGVSLVLAAERWVERADVSPTWFLSDAACWCGEIDRTDGEEETRAIPETPSPTKVPWPASSMNSSEIANAEMGLQLLPSLSTVLHDLAEHNALLLVTLRSSATSGNLRRALLGGIASHGRVGFLQFVRDTVPCESSLQQSDIFENTSANFKGTASEPPLQEFASHFLEEWMWKPCEHLLEVGTKIQQKSATRVHARAVIATADASNPDFMAREENASAAVESAIHPWHSRQVGDSQPASKPGESYRVRLLDLAKKHNKSVLQRSHDATEVVLTPSAVVTNVVCGRMNAAQNPPQAGLGVQMNVPVNGNIDRCGAEGAIESARPDAVSMSRSWSDLRKNPSTQTEVLQELDKRYKLLLSEYIDRSPLTFFEQTIEKYVQILEQILVDGALEGDREFSCAESCESIAKKLHSPRQKVLEHMKSWIVQRKKWEEWIAKKSDEASRQLFKRQHELQALLRLYVARASKRAADPLPSRTMKNVLSALSRFLVNKTHGEKISYVEQVLKPLCGNDLRCTFEKIVDNFGLVTVDDSKALGATVQPASEAIQGSHVERGRQLQASHHTIPTPEQAKVSGEATRTDDWGHKKTSLESSRGEVNLSRAVSRSQSKSSGTGGGENNRGSKQGKQVSRMALGKRDLKEMAMPKKKRLPRAAISIDRKYSGVGMLKNRAGGSTLADGASKRDRKCAGIKCTEVQGSTSKSSRQVSAVLPTRGHSQSFTYNSCSLNGSSESNANDESNDRAPSPGRTEDMIQEYKQEPANASHVMSTPIRCKTAAVVIPETPESKLASNSATSVTPARQPSRTLLLPPVERFSSDFGASAVSCQEMVSSSTETFNVTAAGVVLGGDRGHVAESKQVDSRNEVHTTETNMNGKDGEAVLYYSGTIKLEEDGGTVLNTSDHPDFESRSHAKKSQDKQVKGEHEGGAPDADAMEYFKYQAGDFVLVSTEMVKRNLSKTERVINKTRKIKFRGSVCTVNKIGPFEVLGVEAPSVTGSGCRMLKYRLDVPEILQLHTNCLPACALQIFKTKVEVLTTPLKKRSEKKMARKIGLNLPERVIDVKKVIREGKSLVMALVVWECGHDDNLKYTWEPLCRSTGEVSDEQEIPEDNDEVVSFFQRQQGAWVPSFISSGLQANHALADEPLQDKQRRFFSSRQSPGASSNGSSSAKPPEFAAAAYPLPKHAGRKTVRVEVTCETRCEYDCGRPNTRNGTAGKGSSSPVSCVTPRVAARLSHDTACAFGKRKRTENDFEQGRAARPTVEVQEPLAPSHGSKRPRRQTSKFTQLAHCDTGADAGALQTPSHFEREQIDEGELAGAAWSEGRESRKRSHPEWFRPSRNAAHIDLNHQDQELPGEGTCSRFASMTSAAPTYTPSTLPRNRVRSVLDLESPQSHRQRGRVKEGGDAAKDKEKAVAERADCQIGHTLVEPIKLEGCACLRRHDAFPQSTPGTLRAKSARISCPAFAAGDLVLVSTAHPTVLRSVGNRKNAAVEAFSVQSCTKFIGPFEVKESAGPDCPVHEHKYRLRMPRGNGDVRVHGDVFEAAALCLYQSSADRAASRSVVERSRRRAHCNDDVWPIDFVLDKRDIKCRKGLATHALVAWAGCNVEDGCTWEPIGTTIPEAWCCHLDDGRPCGYEPSPV